MDQDNVATIRGAYNAFARGDFTRLPFDPPDRMDYSPTWRR